MKRKYLNKFAKVLLWLAFCAFSPSMSAYDFTVDGIYYDILSSTEKTVKVVCKEYTVTSSMGYFAPIYYEHYLSDYSGDITIPSHVTNGGTTYEVKWIGRHAFDDSDVTSVVLPNTVTGIDLAAFASCVLLKSISMPNTVTSIGNSAFISCTKLASITIPNSVTSIGEYAFSGCSNVKELIYAEGTTTVLRTYLTSIEKVTIPNSVTSIGECAFYDCSSLASITIPNSVTSIGNSAFSGCSSLGAVHINSLESWCKIIFGDHTNTSNPTYYAHKLYLNNVELKDVNIPSTIETINANTFTGCSNLISVTIPNSVTSIGNYAFSGCSSLPSITIPNSVTSIGYYAFKDCSSLTSITIPNSVTSISDAFQGCSNVKKLIYEEGTKTALRTYLTSIESVTIPNSVTSIGDHAFWCCSSLASVIIPDSVTSIGDHAFYGCSSLASITVHDKVSIGSDAFSDCSNVKELIYAEGTKTAWQVGITSIERVTIPNSVTSIEGYAFNKCYSLASITIPNSVTSIGYDAFRNCSSLASITVHDEVSIGSDAFRDCSNVKELIYAEGTKTAWNVGITSIERVTIPYSVTSIGKRAFYRCSSLASITIPNSVTSIGEYAFYGCSSLASITIPNSVTSIGEYAFFDCSSLPVINNLRYADTYLVEAVDKTLSSYTIKEGTKWIGSHAFEYCSNLSSITVPNSVTSIGVDAFHYCRSLTSITLPNSVTSIEQGAFADCSSLASIILPNSVKSIGDHAFYNCSSLPVIDNIRYADTYLVEAVDKTISSYNIKEGTKWIGCYAFQNCSSLASITLPNSVTSIEQGAFQNCSSLASITLPNSVTSIEQGAFEDCSSLASITIPNSVTSIEYGAFKNCYSLSSITIPNSVTSIGDHAFWGCSGLTEIYCLPTTPPNRYNPFYKTDCPIYVPRESVSAYKTAWSQYASRIYPISYVEEGVIYTILTSTRGGIIWDGTSAKFSGSVSSAALDSNNPNHQFTFVKKEDTDNQYYMVNIGSERFLCQNNEDALLTAYAKDFVTFNSIENEGYPLMIKVSSGDNLNVRANGELAINDYSNPDDGNCFKLEAVGQVDASYLAELKRRIINKCHLITYTSTDNQIVTPTTTVFGDATILSNTYIKSQGVIAFDKDLTEIAEEAFSGCENLKSMELPARVKKIGDSSFEGCSNLSSINIPDSVSNIGKSAYRDCYCLSSISIPSTVVGIGSYAFKGCSALGNVYCYAKEVPSSVTNIFNNTASNKTLYVHKCAIDTYRSTSPWDVFTSYVNLPYNILLTNIDNVSDDCNLVEGDSYSLTDSLKYLEITSSIPSVNLTYTRNFSDVMVGNWQAWYMPCDFDYDDLSDDFDVAEIAGVLFDQDGQNYVAFRKITEGTVKAHTPYVVRAKEAGDAVITATTTLQPTSGAKSFSMQSAYNNFTFGGVYENSYLSAEQPTYAMAKNGNFSLMGSSVYLRPFRIYMRITDREDNPYAAVTTPQEVKVVVLGEDETLIGEIHNSQFIMHNDESTEIYNLGGQKIQKLQKGINIVNGRKVMY